MEKITKFYIIIFGIFICQFGINCTSKKMKKVALIADKNLDVSRLKLLQNANFGHINLYYVVSKKISLEEEEKVKKIYNEIESNSYNLDLNLLFRKEKIPSEIGNLPTLSYNRGNFNLWFEESNKKYEADIVIYMIPNFSSQAALINKFPNLNNIHFVNTKNKDSTIVAIQEITQKYDMIERDKSSN
jgi:hypothetical protein